MTDKEAIADRIAPHTAKLIEAMRMWADNKIHIYELGIRIERELRALAAQPAAEPGAPSVALKALQDIQKLAGAEPHEYRTISQEALAKLTTPTSPSDAQEQP